MSRALIVLNTPEARKTATTWIAKAPDGSRVEFKAPKRTLPQNDLMWAALTDVASQKTHYGNKYTPDEWKVIFLHAIGREVKFIPALEGAAFIPWGQSSSDLSVKEMVDLLDFIFAWGAQNGVKFREQRLAA